MKEIAISCTCMILILPYFECIGFLHIVYAWWIVESVWGFLICPKEEEKRPKTIRNVLSNGKDIGFVENPPGEHYTHILAIIMILLLPR